MKKIKIAKSPTINEALKSEIIAQENSKPTYPYNNAYNYGHLYGYDYDTSDYYDDDDDYGYRDSYWYDNGNDDSDVFYDEQYDLVEKEIYFYENFDLSDDGISNTEPTNYFSNIKELKDYCEENGIYISNYELKSICYSYESYCALDPLSKEYGTLEIVTDTSFDSLWWTIYEENACIDRVNTKK